MRRKNKYSRGRSSAVKLGGGGRGGSIKTEPKTMTASEKAATDDSKIIHHDEDFFAKFNNLSLRETSKERGLSTSNNGKNSKKMSPRGEEQKKGKKKMNILPAMPMPSLKKAVVVDISKATVSSLNGIGGKPKKKKKKNPNGKNAVAVLAAQDQDENSSPNTMYHGSYNVGVYPKYYYYHHPNNQVYYQSNEVYHHGDESYYYHGQGHVVEEGCYYQDDGGAYYQDEESYGQYDSQYYHYPYHYDTDGMAHHYQYFPTVAAEQYPLNVHAEEYSPDDQE